MGDEPEQPTTARPVPAAVLAVELVLAAAIAVWALVEIWWLAHPAGPDTVCPLVHPPTPGCGAGLRYTPAFASAIVLTLAWSGATATLLTVGRRRPLTAAWAVGGLAILGALAVQLVRWGGPVG
ncbi:hypothetical protein ACFQBY_20425 [Promicromonospora citrea]|uniref:Vitamin K epoxide reductase family protein n=1 Tax=Promicromonospora citrea TaxID=43677 RepID=A0A8H9L470_9MICO|nr:hypothetical protein [Promicromonospora citrea]NNH53190.1 hypothetical protein [Promicromonospora citrea]GGM32405.1 hypothetical protein GCM10010102_29760 [Promicromonospora citrea]